MRSIVGTSIYELSDFYDEYQFDFDVEDYLDIYLPEDDIPYLFDIDPQDYELYEEYGDGDVETGFFYTENNLKKIITRQIIMLIIRMKFMDLKIIIMMLLLIIGENLLLIQVAILFIVRIFIL